MLKLPRYPIRSLAALPGRMAGLRRRAAPRCPAKVRPLRVPTALPYLLTAALLILAAGPALAQATGGGGDITTFLQNLVNIITGTAGKLIAVLAICIVGIGALMGALSLRAAGGVILGVMLIFSASWIVTQIVG